MIFLQIAWNNVLRNRRRTIATLISIVFGIAMMVFVNGFNDGMSLQWANSLINETDGHLKVHHKEFYKFGISDMEQVLIEDPQLLIEELQENSHVVAVMPRVSLAGLAGNEENSTIFYGGVQDLTQLNMVLPDHGKIVVEGQPLSADDPNGVIVGQALAKNLGVNVGDELILLSNTVYGDQSSALVFVRGLLQIKNDPKAEQGIIFGGLSDEMREDLLDIGGGTTELVVRIDDMKNVKTVVDWLNQRFAERGDPWVAEPWYSNEDFGFLMAIFNGIGVVIMIVFSLIVSFIISNAMMMSVFERIQEIGSMRAIGMEKIQVHRLFYLEYFMITSIGGVLGLVAGCLLVLVGNHTGISLSGAMFEGVRPVIEIQNLLVSFLVPLIVAAIVVFFPIRSSYRMSVVDSLNYN